MPPLFCVNSRTAGNSLVTKLIAYKNQNANRFQNFDVLCPLNCYVNNTANITVKKDDSVGWFRHSAN